MKRKPTPLHTDIAVIGMACWYPGAQSILQNWENILSRRRQFRRILDVRLPLKDYYDAKKSTPDKTYGKYASYIDGFVFDWMGQRVPKSAYETTDMAHWLALDVAVKALHDSGIEPQKIQNATTGVVVGNSLTGEWSRSAAMRLRWPFVEKSLRAASRKRGLSATQTTELAATMEELYKSVFPTVNEDTLAGHLANTIAGRIAGHLRLGGGGYTVDGACSSSLIAVSTAANHLASRQMDMVLAGGVDISLDTMELIGFAKVGALTESEMRVYDRRASGFIPGEGCGFVTLKRLEDAVRDGDQIYAVLKGWGLSSDGAKGITTPTKNGQSLAIGRAYSMAGYTLADCQFVEGHGTGTHVGDRVEIEGLALTMSQTGRIPKPGCGLTSFKSIVGHTKAAAGIGSFIKAVLCVNRRVLAPVAGTDQPNAAFQGTGIYPILTGEVRPSDEKMRGGISAMGFGGINCHVTVESYGKPSIKLASAIPENSLLVSYEDSEVLVLAANDISELREKIKSLAQEVTHASEAEITDLAYELARRNNDDAKYKAAILCRRAEQLQERISILETMLLQPLHDGKTYQNADQTVWVSNTVHKPRLAFLFPGQGSQKLNMGRDILQRFEWAQTLVEQAGASLSNTAASNIEAKIYRNISQASDPSQLEEWSAEISLTEVAQPGICLASLLWLKRLNKIGIFAHAVGGHSLGELTAFHCAGALSETELLQLAATRGRLMAAKSEDSGEMASLSCGEEEAENLVAAITEYAVIANVNSHKQTILSGTRSGIAQVLQQAQLRGIATQKLRVSNAFHSKIIKPGADRLLKEAQIPGACDRLEVKLFTCIDGTKVSNGTQLKEHFARQITEKVNFIKLIESISKNSDLLIEVGPGQVLSGLVNSLNVEKGPMCLPVEAQPGQQLAFNKVVAAAFVHGVKLRWDEVYKNRCVRAYVPPMQKEFFVNPCERKFPESLLSTIHEPPVIIGPSRSQNVISMEAQPKAANRPSPSAAVPASIPQPKNVEAMILDLVTEKTGFARSAINFKMRLLDDLNLDSIKAGEIIATLARDLHIETEIEPSRFANATLEEIFQTLQSLAPKVLPFKSPIPMPVSLLQSMPPLVSQPLAAFSAENEHADPEALLVSLVAEKTGFAKTAIHLNMRLLDDLNLDSIKAGEIIVAISRELNVTADIEPSRFANATLSEIIEGVSSLIVSRSDTAAFKKTGTDDTPFSVPAPPMLLRPIASEASNPQAILLSLISERTGFAPEVLNPKMRLLDDLNLDSIKAGEIIASFGGKIGFAGMLEPSQLANATINEIVALMTKDLSPVPSSPAPVSIGNIDPVATNESFSTFQCVVEAIAEVVGYTLASIKPEDALSTDLGLSLSQISEVIGIASLSIPSASLIAPESVVQYNVRQLAKIFDNISDSSKKMGLVNQLPEQSTIFNIKDWVRNFAVDYIPQLRKKIENRKRRIDDWPTLHFLLISEAEPSLIADEFEKETLRRGSRITRVGPGQAAINAWTAEGSITHIVSFLFENGISPKSDVKDLHKLIHLVSTTSSVPKTKKLRALTVGFIQFGGGNFGENHGKPILGQYGTKAIAQALHEERADLRVRTIDVSPSADHVRLAAELAEEFITPEPFAAVGFDEKLTRFVPVPRLISPLQQNPRSITWTRNDVVLVTGGGKGITAECALALAKKLGVKLAILGSTPAASADDELVRNLRRLKDEGIDFGYYSCNIADASALKEQAEKIKAELGPITGVIHGSGLNKPRRLEQVNTTDAMAEIAPKVIGAINLFSLLENAPPKMFCAFTSILGIANVAGNGWYGFSNETLNLLLRSFRSRHPQTQTVSMAFGMWSEVGMAARLGSGKKFSKTGVGLVPLEEGVQRFLNLFENDPGIQQVAIVPRLWQSISWEVRRNQLPAASRFLEKIITRTDGVEVISRVHLTLEDDLYLKDHCYKGSYLFPTVFGLEAMAQAAGFACGNGSIESLCFEDVRLERPISVDPKVGSDIEIYAEVQESTLVGGIIHVHCGIRTASTGYKKDHFAAEIYFNKKLEPIRTIKKDLAAIDYNTDDLYSWLLFHGPKYRRIQDILEWTADYCSYEGRVEAEQHNQAASFSEKVAKPLLIGDPYFRDSILQAGQIPTLKTRSLPYMITKIEIHSIDKKPTTRQVHFQIDGCEQQTWHASAFAIDGSGNVTEKIINYQSKILEQKPQDPNPVDFVKNIKHRPFNLEREFKTFTHFNKNGSVIMAAERIDGFEKMQADERHAHELRLARKALRDLCGGKAINEEDIQIRWLETGKPTLIYKAGDFHLSVTHSGSTCVCVLSSGPIGCDLEVIEPRQPEDWKKLLGASKSEIFKNLYAELKSHDLVGISIWTANESFAKAFGSHDFTIERYQLRSGLPWYTASLGDVRFECLGFPTEIGLGQKYYFSLATPLPASSELERKNVAAKQADKVKSDEKTIKIDYPSSEIFRAEMTDDNEFIARWPVTFREAGNLGRGVYFSHFFKWQGQVRELAMWPALKAVTEDFADGKFGMVTNFAETKFHGEARVNDVIEAHFSLRKTKGREGNTIDTFYDWRKIGPDGKIERVALSQMQISWVKVKGHGVVELAPFPPAFDTILNAVSRTPEDVILPQKLDAVDYGRLLFKVPDGSIKLPMLSTKIFSTTLEDSNLVGNLYFSNYSAWQGRVRDRFFKDILGEQPYAEAHMQGGEFLCKFSGTRHLREAMPFDSVEVIMSLREVYECGVKLQLDYFRISEGRREKIAHGEHQAVWAKNASNGVKQASPLPKVLVYHLLSAANAVIRSAG